MIAEEGLVAKQTIGMIFLLLRELTFETVSSGNCSSATATPGQRASRTSSCYDPLEASAVVNIQVGSACLPKLANVSHRSKGRIMWMLWCWYGRQKEKINGAMEIPLIDVYW